MKIYIVPHPEGSWPRAIDVLVAPCNIPRKEAIANRSFYLRGWFAELGEKCEC